MHRDGDAVAELNIGRRQRQIGRDAQGGVVDVVRLAGLGHVIRGIGDGPEAPTQAGQGRRIGHRQRGGDVLAGAQRVAQIDRAQQRAGHRVLGAEGDGEAAGSGQCSGVGDGRHQG